MLFPSPEAYPVEAVRIAESLSPLWLQASRVHEGEHGVIVCDIEAFGSPGKKRHPSSQKIYLQKQKAKELF